MSGLRENWVMMPSRKEMVKALEEASIYGKDPLRDQFYDVFIGDIASSEKNGLGLVMAWHSANDEILSNLELYISAIVSIGFVKVLEALDLPQALITEAKTFKEGIGEESSEE